MCDKPARDRGEVSGLLVVVCHHDLHGQGGEEGLSDYTRERRGIDST